MHPVDGHIFDLANVWRIRDFAQSLTDYLLNEAGSLV